MLHELLLNWYLGRVRLAIEEIEEPSANASEAYERAQKIASSAEGKPLAVWRFAPDALDGLVRR